jgi:biopolymer transport protein ExbD
MQFRAHRRRQAPTVIIVALIDVLIVLLIFLMATTTFNKQQSSIPLALPQSSQAHKAGASENAPLIVTIDEKGVVRLGADAHPVSLEQLKTELMDAVEKKPGLQVAVNADKNSPLGEFVKVWDIAKEAKLNAVNLRVKEAAPQQ